MSSIEAANSYCYSNEDRDIASQFMVDAYDSLLMLARNQRRRARLSSTMMTEDILHECFLKLSGKTIWQSYEQYLKTASLAIRQVIVDHIRRNLTQKRGAGIAAVTISGSEDILPEFNESPEEILLINDLLEKLEARQPRLSVIVNARYFAALTEAETAEALGVSERTVRRDWQAARNWLAAKMDVV